MTRSLTPQRVNPASSFSWVGFLVPIVLFGVLTVFYYHGLGDYGLFDPWETHYGEVARDMVERDNFIDPYWGSPWDNADVKRERSGFYSKPPLTMWMMAAGMKIFGVNALGVRALLPLMALCALLSVFLTLRRLSGTSAAVFTTLCTATFPSFAFLSHQSVTDGPMVCLVLLGMMSLVMAFSSDKHTASGPLKYGTLLLITLIIAGQLWVIWPMDRSPDAIRTSPYSHIALSSQWYLVELFTVARGKGWVIALTLLPFALFGIHRISRLNTARDYHFILFFVWCGLTVPAKGWLGWAPMGGALFFYLLLTGEWSWITSDRVKNGLITVGLTGHIWVLAMLGGHHPEWVNRFIYHDHINRLFTGVHSTDDGAFEYFFQWIGYGLFPLVALVPLSLLIGLHWGVRPLKGDEGDEVDEQKRLSPLVKLTTLWAIIGIALFTKSSTKFHHYIFPVLPALSILVGLALSRLWEDRLKISWITAFSCMGVLLWVGGDIARPSRASEQGAQHWINLFTYKYDRQWPIQPTQAELEGLEREAASEAWLTTLSLPLKDEELANHHEPLAKAYQDQSWNDRLTQPIQVILLVTLLALMTFALQRLWVRRLGIALVCLASIMSCGFALHIYLPTVATHWSQWELWDIYYRLCDPLPKTDPEAEERTRAQLLTFSSRVPSDLEVLPAWCQAPAIAFRMNWRGEAFYTHNTVVPALYTKDLKPILQTWGVWDSWQPDKRFFIFTERSRIKTELERSLPQHLKGQYREVFGEGRRFVLLEVNPDETPRSKMD